MSRPPRPTSAPAQQRRTSATPQPTSTSNAGIGGAGAGLVSTSDGYATVTSDGEVLVGRLTNSVVYRRRHATAHALGRGTPMVLDGRYVQLPKEYVFGAANNQDAEGTGAILHTWKSFTPAADKLRYDFGRDFMSLNRASVANRCTTPLDVKWFRETHDSRLKPKRLAKRRQHQQSPDGCASVSAASGGLDVTRMRAAGISSDRAATPDLRFAHAIGGAATPFARDTSSMSALVAHEYRYAWVAQKITEHEDLARARAASVAPTSQPRRAAANDSGAPPSASGSAGGGSRYPKLVCQRVAEARAMSEHVHPKEHFTLKQFRDVPSRHALESGLAFQRPHSALASRAQQ